MADRAQWSLDRSVSERWDLRLGGLFWRFRGRGVDRELERGRQMKYNLTVTRTWEADYAVEFPIR